METIIGLLFIFLPVILKLVGKRLEKAGQPEKAKAVRDFIEEHLEVEEWIEEAVDETAEEADGNVLREEFPDLQPVVMHSEPVEIPTVQPAVQKRPLRKTVLPDVEPEKKGEKIDPKKLVIYSEIMKPKF